MRIAVGRMGAFAATIVCAAYFSASAQALFSSNRIYKIRTKTSLNAGWKFYLNDPTDTADAYKSSFSDASWATVNVPHSALYVRPDEVAEKCTTPAPTTWSGFCWYRKSFTVPQTGANQRYFLQFDGAMQTAQVWLNGTLIGTHMSGGFTGFTYDVTSLINTAGTNLLALRLDCTYRWDVPPGNVPSTTPSGGSEGQYPDFLLFSGLCRDVWLVATGNVHIPFYGQKVTTPYVSTTRATVRVQTIVNNASAAPQVCTVQFVVTDPTNAIVEQKSLSQTVAAGASVIFDQTTDSLVNPKLWAPATPYLYEVFTKVFVDSQAVDDNVERFGIRSIAWSTTSGFSLNGQQFLEKGVCMHQEFAWVGQALPDSRYYQEVLIAKNAGFNAIRCAHNPRPPAFYDACDYLGMLCEPEVPFWGGSMSYYPPAFWSRLDSAAMEMVKVGINHPSIIQWGIANEPNAGFDTQFRQECTIIKSLDSSRFTAIINNKNVTENLIPDLIGYNYNTTYPTLNKGLYTAEYHQGWMYFCRRGDSVSRAGHGSPTLPPAGFFAYTDTNCYGGSGCTEESDSAFTECYSSTASGRGWMNIQNNTGAGKPLAGGNLWVMVDYNSDCNIGSHHMGILDQYRIPKKAYYSFQTNWTTIPADYPSKGLTPVSLRLEADDSNLVADSTDISRIIVSVRDASGKCVWSFTPVTLQVTGPANIFDTINAPRTTIAGKIGYILKSTNTPGTITITATATGGLAAATMTITSTAPNYSPLPFIWPGSSGVRSFAGRLTEGSISMRQTGQSIILAFPSRETALSGISLVNLQGKAIVCPMARAGVCVEISTRTVAKGFYFLKITTSDQVIMKRVLLVK